MKKKLLLDENLPRNLIFDFSDEFEVFTVSDLGWSSYKNGELFRAIADAGIEYLLTVDKNLRYQQNLNKFNVKVGCNNQSSCYQIQNLILICL